MTRDAVHIRCAGREEAPVIAAILRESFDAALPRLAGLHTPEDDLAFVRDALFKSCDIACAGSGGVLAGFAAVNGESIEQFYLRPAFQRRGIGSALLAHVRKGRRQLELWTFQENVGARAFYARHGFIEAEMTDGAGSEEKAPDVHMVWRR
ncbi:MAG: N-acetyltransferase family protein [Oceanicaulis sp.]